MNDKVHMTVERAERIDKAAGHNHCHHDKNDPNSVQKKIDAGAIYTCPMHPEIRQKGPGSCPKCGMALEPLISENADDAEYRDMLKRFWLAAVFTVPLFS